MDLDSTDPDSGLFGTAGIRGDVAERMTPALASRVGRAAAADGGPFVLGRDGRTTGPALVDAVAAGLESGGAAVRRAGVLPTPALAHASRGRRGVMVTASHNPPPDNGLKLFVDGSEYGDDAEARIADRVADTAPPVDWERWGGGERIDALDAYRDAVLEYARGHGAAPDGLRAVVDCGNGTAGLATPRVLDRLGADVTALDANVDGHFPGRESKPTADALAGCRAFLADADADLGIAHDGDADRIVLLDGDGAVVQEDTVVAVLARHYVDQSDAADPVVVTTPNASGRIDEQVSAAGGRVERVCLGALHEGIADARAGGEVVFAAEPWKHVHPAFGGWIDGVASAGVLVRLVAAAGGVGALRADVTERPYRKENVPCPDDRKAATMDRVAETLPAAFPDADVDTEYGVRLDRPGGAWVLVRPSGTEPYVRVYAESEAVDDLVAAAVEVVEDAVAGAD